MGLPTFSPYAEGTLVARAAVAADQIEIEIGADAALVARHVRPGQFCRVRASGPGGVRHEGIFALLSAPREARLRFLLRTPNPEGGEAADLLASLPLGAAVEISEPTGDGYELSLAHGRDVYFVATGTAIAPVRAALDVALGQRDAFGRLRLDLGVRSAGHVALAHDLTRFRDAGVDVHVHVSTPRPDGGVDGVRAHDAALEAAAPALGRAVFVVAGQSAMVAELRREVVARGGAIGDVLHNY